MYNGKIVLEKERLQLRASYDDQNAIDGVRINPALFSPDQIRQIGLYLFHDRDMSEIAIRGTNFFLRFTQGSMLAATRFSAPQKLESMIDVFLASAKFAESIDVQRITPDPFHITKDPGMKIWKQTEMIIKSDAETSWAESVIETVKEYPKAEVMYLPRNRWTDTVHHEKAFSRNPYWDDRRGMTDKLAELQQHMLGEMDIVAEIAINYHD